MLCLGPSMPRSVVFTVRCCVALQVIRNYHGHLSGVYSLAQHPTVDIIMTGGRDAGAIAAAWDTISCCVAAAAAVRVLVCVMCGVQAAIMP
jgi:hypothetical protein